MMVEYKLFRLKRIKAQVFQYLPVLFLIFAIIFMVLGVSDNPKMNPIRAVVIETTLPIVRVIKAPLYWVKDGIRGIKQWTTLYSENARLKSENEQLLSWRSKAIQLQTEQVELQQFLKYIPPKEVKTIVAQVALDEGGAFSRSFIVQAGQLDGVKKGMLAFTSKGLFARVVALNDSYARLMPFTDYMSRVPVWVGENKYNAFMIGDNTNNPIIQLSEKTDMPIQVGDLVLTSGYVGVFPPNIPVGVVATINEDEIRVELLENTHHNSFVQLVDFGLNHVLLETEL